MFSGFHLWDLNISVCLKRWEELITCCGTLIHLTPPDMNRDESYRSPFLTVSWILCALCQCSSFSIITNTCNWLKGRTISNVLYNSGSNCFLSTALAPRSDLHLVSPYNIYPKSFRKRSPTKEPLDCSTNSPCQLLKKCIKNSIENIHTDGRVYFVIVHKESLNEESKNLVALFGYHRSAKTIKVDWIGIVR